MVVLVGIAAFIIFFQWSTTSINDYTTQVHSEYSYQALLDLPELEQTLQTYLYRHGYVEDDQGILIETLDSGLQIASINSEKLFNPASTLKLATSIVALEKWGPRHRFQTAFYADGYIDPFEKSLEGNLVLTSDGDPTFRLGILGGAVSEMKNMGIRRVTGDLIFDGPLTINSLYDPITTAQKVKTYLIRNGIRIDGNIRFEKRTGTHLVSHFSSPLLDILWTQNAHSKNTIADRLGDAIGGSEMLAVSLFQIVGVPLNEIFITHSSGLDYNRITPRAMLKIIRHIIRWCSENEVSVDKLVPVAGVDVSTVRLRFSKEDLKGGVLAKTGTLLVTDDGISALAGVINTQKYGMVLFALFNSRGDVFAFQKWQNNFLEKIIERCGGIEPFRLHAHNESYVYGNRGWSKQALYADARISGENEESVTSLQ
ncbi:D-alanyl-D-alanine carboxypeptidase [candidate division KSB1 bacterium]|nr:D-alanyl-D-alanine carboxypeptidase [candidate division KSB1 bacterium]